MLAHTQQLLLGCGCPIAAAGPVLCMDCAIVLRGCGYCSWFGHGNILHKTVTVLAVCAAAA